LFRIKYPDARQVRPLAVGTYYSRAGQDLFLSALLFNYLRNHPGAWVVDGSGAHPEYFSNTLFFEQRFECRTLALGVPEELLELWMALRPSARCRPDTGLQPALSELGIEQVLLLTLPAPALAVLEGIRGDEVSVKAILVDGVDAPESHALRRLLQHRDYLFVARIDGQSDVYLQRSMLNGLSSL
jgi:hypothetical protein